MPTSGANFVPNTIGPGGWGGDWYVWHAPDGLRARAATGLGCMQAGVEKLGVIEASYASAIIGVDNHSRLRIGASGRSPLPWEQERSPGSIIRRKGRPLSRPSMVIAPLGQPAPFVRLSTC